MKNIPLLLSIIILSSCTTMVSKHFKNNQYSDVILNDGLTLSIMTFGDIKYEKDEKKLKEIITSENFKLNDKVLAYGTTKNPSYRFYITESKNNNSRYHNNLYTRDTTITNRTIKIIGYTDSKMKISMQRDIDTMIESIVIGTGYNDFD